MKYTYYIFSFLTILLIILTPANFHNDQTALFDKIILISVATNMALGKINTYKIKKYNFLLISTLQFIYCLTSVNYYDHNNIYSLRVESLFFSKNKIFYSDILYIFETFSFYILLLLIIFQIRSFILVLYSAPSDNKKL